MRPSKILISLAVLLSIFLASQAQAEISDAAVLYLRIAPGARAAGMGEAYVAISDDATCTHWNPAGLGAFPLSPSWTDADVPADLIPLKQVAALRSRGGPSYTAYDIWAITPRGLARFDNKQWNFGEIFSTKTDQTLRKIVASYFNLTDETLIDEVSARVAADNATVTYAEMDSLLNAVVAAFPADYSSYTSLQNWCDSLREAYNQCLINWSEFDKIDRELEKGLEDGSFSYNEMEKVFFTLPRSKMRFLPEELTIDYSRLFDGELKHIAAASEFLLVGSDKGLYAYDGERWLTLTLHNNLPSTNITSLYGGETAVWVGTDKGVVRFDGENLSIIGEPGQLPEGAVAGLAEADADKAWAVVDGRLYFFDGAMWSDSRFYTVVLDDSIEKIAEKLALYGSAAEKDKLIARIKELNATTDADGAPQELLLEPGMLIRIPFVAEIKGDIEAMIYDVNHRLWIGTSYGLAYWEDYQWTLPGYRDVVVKNARTVEDLVSGADPVPYDPAVYRDAVADINDIEGDLTEGQTVKLYRNPTAAPIHSIRPYAGSVYIGTAAGLVEYEAGAFRAMALRGLDKANVMSVETHGNGLWFATDRQVITRASGRTDISLMYVKWLPELASDLYYAFASVATHKEGWGTFGGNITFINYGTIIQTSEQNIELGSFEAFDLAVTGSYGTPVTKRLSLGGSAKFLYSKLAPQGAGEEQGEGTSTGFAIDVGMLYKIIDRLDLGVAITNLGPDMAYIDAAQSDPLPRNLAVGLAYKALQRDYYHLLVTAEVNKSLVGVDDPFREELKQLVLNGGTEFLYSNILALRAGYIYDQEGDIKTATLGVGIGPLGIFKFDFSYIPSNTDAILANTLRLSLSVQP